MGSVPAVLTVAGAAVCILLLLQGCSCPFAGGAGTQVSLGVAVPVLCGQTMLLLTRCPSRGLAPLWPHLGRLSLLPRVVCCWTCPLIIHTPPVTH